MHNENLYQLLETKTRLYNRPEFIEKDPISIPRRYTLKQDIEIAGLLAASIAWGNRVSVINNASKLMGRMGNEPYNFLQNASGKEYSVFGSFVHRTFNGDDCLFFLQRLASVYQEYESLEDLFLEGYLQDNTIKSGLCHMRSVFFSQDHLIRTEKHFSNPAKGAAAKRLNMFLRWMARKDDCEVDFGIWKNVSQKDLMVPLDVHTGRVARKLGLLERKKDDWKAVEELTAKLREFDPHDPVKYDFALFGMGIFERFGYA